MIYLKVKDGNEENAKFIIGGDPEAIYLQSICMIESIMDLFVENYGTTVAEKFLTDFISDLTDDFKDTFLKEYKRNENV